MSEFHRFNIRMPKELMEWYKERAEEMGVNTSAYIVMTLFNLKQQTEQVNIFGGMVEQVKLIDQQKQ